MHSPSENQHFLQLAFNEAQAAALAGEVPVGAVVVKSGQVIATGRNAPIGSHDPTAHAEIVALRAAAAVLGNYRLDGCELYVTLEPCAMCAGAMLHARIQRVVFAVPDPKTGAAGSVTNLFSHAALNHQTEAVDATHLGAAYTSIVGASGQLLQNFFTAKRQEKRLLQLHSHSLRHDALRTPDSAFANLPGYPWSPQYLSDLPSLAGLRMHYLDIAAQAANPPASSLANPPAVAGSTARCPPPTYLCLHGNPAWSYLYRKMIPIFTASGARVVAPDMIGFGKSDKPKKDGFHSFTWHRQCLLELVERLDLKNIVLVVQDWGGLLGLTLPMAAPQRYQGLVVMNTTLATGDTPLSKGFIAWREMCAKNPAFDIARLFARGNPQMSPAECATYMAPYPDAGHRAATRAFPPMVPEFLDSDGAAVSREAKAFWQTQWSGQTLMAIGTQDPVLGEPVMRGLQQMIRGCPEPMLLPEAGHFVQEQGEEVARRAVALFSV
jgi:tRNA(adenine34) deaminase